MSIFYERKGSAKEWAKATQLYNRPGNEDRAFCLFAGFGSALMKFTDKEGGLIHLENNTSGIGKSAILEMVNSIWGHPTKPLILLKDTNASRMKIPTTLGNIPMTIDELTNMRETEVSDFVFAITDGRDKHRMQSQVNEIRSNPLRWALICFSTGNKSLVDILQSRKESPEGELKRMFEFHIENNDTLSKAESDAMLAPIKENYGCAGEVFIKYVIAHLPEVKQLLREVQAEMDKTLNFINSDRYWSAMVACAITAGFIAKKLGLHQIDVARVKAWIVKFIRNITMITKSHKVNAATCVGQYMSENLVGRLSINGNSGQGSMLPIVFHEPRGALTFRYEPDTKLLFVPVKEFRLWCSKNQISYSARVAEMAKEGILKETTKKRMLKGTGMSAPAVSVLTIDGTKLDIDHEELIDNEN